MRKERIISLSLAVLGITLGIYSCTEPDALSDASYSEWLSGGKQTVFNRGASAFSSAFPDLTEERARVHDIGDNGFGQTFVSAPAPKNPGLGPIFNNVSCTSCHINDGRGKPPVNGDQLTALLIRLSIQGTDAHGGPNPAPGFGVQLQQRAVFGYSAEAQVLIDYIEKNYTYGDGEAYTLRFPTYRLENPYTPLPADLMTSPRIAPPVFGLGLLEAVSDEDILAMADETDANDDGISGKPNYVWNVKQGKRTLGRFGWKANNPDILQQSAGAYNEDMGITSFVFQDESCKGQAQYDGEIHGYEVTDSLLQCVAFYIRTLAVPARRNADDAVVLQGKKLFTEAGCASCHVPRLRTKTDVAFPEISNQVIFPYTDLLLHDMGADLADGRPDFDANGQEWRTPPLWGIGLTRVVNGHQNFLHDGRARTLAEAILWHGGEGTGSREHFRKLSGAERDALIKFLESL